MSSQVEEMATLPMGKGAMMRTFVDHGKPDKPSWVEIIYDGKEDSDLAYAPMHWHRDHDEITDVQEGSMMFYVDGKEIIKTVGDPPLVVPRGHIHGFTASTYAISLKSVKGVAVRATERTRPAGTFKIRFFQDLLQTGRMPGFFMMMRAAYDGDMYPALPGGFKSLEWLFVTIFGTLARPFVLARPANLRKKQV